MRFTWKLGFADDEVELPWRMKIFESNMTSQLTLTNESNEHVNGKLNIEYSNEDNFRQIMIFHMEN